MNYPPQKPDFVKGLVFGFDVGTGSIGYAIRQGDKFLDVGVLICDSEGGDLSKRRDLRRARRTLRSKKYRRQWLSAELVKIGLSQAKTPSNNPIELRVRAINGEKLLPEELHTALFHLFRRRGYSVVPWANREAARNKVEDKEEGAIKEFVSEMRSKLNGRYPCQYLQDESNRVGKCPTERWARKIYWPREALEAEFRAIVAAQATNFPELLDKTDWLLYGDTQIKRKGKNEFHVYFKNSEGRNPGMLSMKWPRFDNRGPALDSLQPLDSEGKPLHVVRKNKAAFISAQWELALMNFRVLDAKTRQKIDPCEHFPIFIEELHSEWNKKGQVTITRLKELALPFAEKFLLIEEQPPLTPEKGTGRARYSSPTLNTIRAEIAAGHRVDPPQPILRRDGESAEDALNRYLADIKHPAVRHRLVLFRRLLAQFVQEYGQPDIIVLEAVRSLALGKKARNELNKRNEEHRKEREQARGDLAAVGKSYSRKAIIRYRLWKETQSTCPFCCEKITQAQLLNGEADIEHLVPRSLVDCSELYNLTVGHIHCNREVKGDKTPFVAFSGQPAKWEMLKANAEKCFKGRKLEIFLSPNAEELIERSTDLQHTAYIARVIRGVALLTTGWIGKDGRDPTIEKGNLASSSFQVTNGQLTSRLRGAWGLNQLLHPLPSGQRWDDLPDDEKSKFAEKNRGDLRHHALDAMVIACTLPWLAHRTHGAKDEDGRHGWWSQDEKHRSKAANPVFPHTGLMHKVCKEEIENIIVRHHVSRSNHRQSYATTLYAKKAPDTYVAREVFTSLTPKNLGSIWPQSFAYYCKAAWSHYEEEADVSAELKKTKGCLPETFTSRLCFSHFQRWREREAPEFAWPEKVKIPIRSVRLISVKDDTAVAPFGSGTHAYVKRTGFKEVRIYPSADGKGFVPVFIPYWKGDKPIHDLPYEEDTKPMVIIRRGMLVETQKESSAGWPSGKYRVLVTGQEKIKLLPPYVANKEDAFSAFNLPKRALQLVWPDFVRCLGYEPHPPPPEP